MRGAAGEQALEHAGAGRVHGVEYDVEAGGAQSVHVDETRDVGVVCGSRVDALDQARRHAIVEGDALGTAGAASGLDCSLEGVYDLWRCAAGVLGLVLEAVVGAGVVRGGDHDGAARLLVEDGVAGHRRRGGRIEDEGLDAVRGDNLGAGGGEVLRGKARIEADDDASSGEPRVLEITRDSLRAIAHIVEGVVFGDDRAPAVGAELIGVAVIRIPPGNLIG